mmetsp:Transcript_5529/g.23442  ORF Transcript_5529/g.23442 Transcript_5529/m.23442 type:complete len:722 (+) Transcript_5529:643-2808(+)
MGLGEDADAAVGGREGVVLWFGGRSCSGGARRSGSACACSWSGGQRVGVRPTRAARHELRASVAGAEEVAIAHFAESPAVVRPRNDARHQAGRNSAGRGDPGVGLAGVLDVRRQVDRGKRGQSPAERVPSEVQTAAASGAGKSRAHSGLEIRADASVGLLEPGVGQRKGVLQHRHSRGEVGEPAVHVRRAARRAQVGPEVLLRHCAAGRDDDAPGTPEDENASVQLRVVEHRLNAEPVDCSGRRAAGQGLLGLHRRGLIVRQPRHVQQPRRRVDGEETRHGDGRGPVAVGEAQHRSRLRCRSLQHGRRGLGTAVALVIVPARVAGAAAGRPCAAAHASRHGANCANAAKGAHSSRREEGKRHQHCVGRHNQQLASGLDPVHKEAQAVQDLDAGPSFRGGAVPSRVGAERRLVAAARPLNQPEEAEGGDGVDDDDEGQHEELQPHEEAPRELVVARCSVRQASQPATCPADGDQNHEHEHDEGPRIGDSGDHCKLHAKGKREVGAKRAAGVGIREEWVGVCQHGEEEGRGQSDARPQDDGGPAAEVAHGATDPSGRDAVGSVANALDQRQAASQHDGPAKGGQGALKPRALSLLLGGGRGPRGRFRVGSGRPGHRQLPQQRADEQNEDDGSLGQVAEGRARGPHVDPKHRAAATGPAAHCCGLLGRQLGRGCDAGGKHDGQRRKQCDAEQRLPKRGVGSHGSPGGPLDEQGRVCHEGVEPVG